MTSKHTQKETPPNQTNKHKKKKRMGNGAHLSKQ